MIYNIKCSFSIGKVLAFGCLGISKIVSSASVKIFCFHFLRLNLWMPCLLHQLALQEFRLETRSDFIFLKFVRLLRPICDKFSQMVVINNPDIAGQYVSMVFILKTRICTMAWQDGVVPEKLLKLEILNFMDFSTV